MAGVVLDIHKLRQKKRNSSFFLCSAQNIAKKILGDYLVFRKNKTTLIGKIVETEAYLGKEDDASHSFSGKITPRNKIMYSSGGKIYIYLIYGQFWCFNIVVANQGDPQAVFIRALEPLKGIEIMAKNRKGNLKNLTNGPCRWTSAFGIDKRFLGKDIFSENIFISRNFSKKFEIIATKRIGVDYAEKSKDLPLRFYIKGNQFVSKH